MASLYEKQMEWRKAAALKAQQTTAKDTTKEYPFTPTFYTQQSVVRQFEGPARELSESAGQKFAERNARARLEKQQREDKMYGRKSTPAAIRAPSSSSAQAAPSSSVKPPSPQLHVVGGNSEVDTSHMSEKQLRETLLKYAPAGTESGGDLSALDELTVVELLERERRQWHAERIKLIHCIHLQQLELASSASAAQSRASEIAKEFVRAIEGFEERLVNMESNVQKELTAIKAIASDLGKKV
jgi:hypothetical protein